ncbi:MAG: type II toxin-antitoxin system PemK/MazF family toxin [Candidatus Woesearchaeota archaeon]
MKYKDRLKPVEFKVNFRDINTTYRQGDIIYVDLRPVIGCEENGIRPCVIIQNNAGNTFSPTLIIAPISKNLSKKAKKKKMPTHYFIEDYKKLGLKFESYILFEQIKAIDKSRVQEKIGHIDPKRFVVPLVVNFFGKKVKGLENELVRLL